MGFCIAGPPWTSTNSGGAPLLPARRARGLEGAAPPGSMAKYSTSTPSGAVAKYRLAGDRWMPARPAPARLTCAPAEAQHVDLVDSVHPPRAEGDEGRGGAGSSGHREAEDLAVPTHHGASGALAHPCPRDADGAAVGDGEHELVVAQPAVPRRAERIGGRPVEGRRDELRGGASAGSDHVEPGAAADPAVPPEHA